jgi:hypothetical protein
VLRAGTLHRLLVVRELDREKLQRDLAAERDVVGKIDDAHAPAAEDRLDAIVSDDVAWVQRRALHGVSLIQSDNAKVPEEPWNLGTWNFGTWNFGTLRFTFPRSSASPL